MGLMDSLKKATGLGLTHHQHYDRAFEKGVLLGPSKYDEASSLFEAAARKAAEAGDAQLQTRASANALLYRFVAKGDVSPLDQLKTHLEQLEQIECIGGRNESVPGKQLAAEVEGRLLEHQILTTSDYGQRAVLHQKASEAFKKIFSAPLITYRFHANDAHTQTAQSRFFFHQGMMAWSQAQDAAPSDPDAAAEHAGRALSSFRQCQDQDWSQKSDSWLALFRTRRTCWMCHRELQGLGVHIRSYPAVVTPYVVALVNKLGHDASSLDSARGQIVLCAPCGTAVERQADHYATERTRELREEVNGELRQMQSTINQLTNVVEQLQRMAHTH
jgi:hypothetical protein